MKGLESVPRDKQLFYRIVAMWAVCEGTLGGIIHGFNLPGTGLVISSASVICISIIAWYYPVKGAILKATIIVSVFKMMLSPHSPPTAYIAVFFQGFMGEILFTKKKHFRLACMLLAVLALVESSIQRILVLTLIYGNALWTAIDTFITRLTGSETITNYSWYIGVAYVLLHFIIGILVGRFAGQLPSKLSIEEVHLPDAVVQGGTAVRKKRGKVALLITWLVLLGLYIQSSFRIGTPLLPPSMPLEIILRSMLIIFLWYFIASPLLSFWLKNWLAHKQYKMKPEVEVILDLIPSTRELLYRSWQQTADVKGIKRLALFAKVALARTVQHT